MKAVVLRENGAPSVLKVEDWPIPVPAPGEVLLRVGAVGVPYHDIVERNGTLRPGHGLPKVMGNEIAGTVAALGPEVRTLKVGDRVAAKGFHTCGQCRWCRTGRETMCPQARVIGGGYAEFAAIPAEALVPIPDALDFPTACMLGSSTSVALNALRDVAKVRLGETVLVTGASGGVGLPAIEVAKAAGARVIGLTRGDRKAEAIRQAGADHVLLNGDSGDFWRDVMELTGGEGVDVVVDTVGSQVFTPAFRSLAPYGRYIVIGQLSRDEISINLARIMFRCITIVGVRNARRDHLADAVAMTASGVLHPPVAKVLPLDRAAEAHEIVESGALVGRVVLVP
jgi:acryloyl-coenzyme A reductase